MGKTRKENSFLEQAPNTRSKDETPNQLVLLFHLQLQVPQRPRKVGQEFEVLGLCLFQIGIYVFFHVIHELAEHIYVGGFLWVFFT